MTTGTATPQASTDRELLLTRVLDAPRELVFEAWTNPSHLPRWWGPHGFSTTTQTLDVRPGGSWRYLMHGPDGTDYPNLIAYDEIVRPERLVYTHSSGAADDPGQFQVTVTFAEQDGKTLLSMHMRFASAEALAEVKAFGAVELGYQTLDSLAQHVASMASSGGQHQAAAPKSRLIAEPGSHAMTMTRVFDAPRELVFRAYTDPELIPHWWGPRYLTTTVDVLDLRPGGSWRFVQRDAQGNQYAFHGVYHDLVPPARLVATFEFEGMPGHVLMETVTFEEQDGKTLLTASSVFQSVADRDGLLSTGMQEGADDSMERLAELLARI